MKTLITIPRQEDRVFLLHRNGHREAFASVAAIAKKYGSYFVSFGINDHFNGQRCGFYINSNTGERVRYSESYHVADWVILDAFGRILSRLDIDKHHHHFLQEQARLRELHNGRWQMEHLGSMPGVAVPGTGRQRRFRKTPFPMKGFKEQICVLPQEGEPPIRAKRTQDYCYRYDDFYDEVGKERNWKNYRRTQWKAA